MCARYTNIATWPEIVELYQLTEPFEPVEAVEPPADFWPRYAIAPGQMAPIVRLSSTGRELAMLRWGLVPSWATTASVRLDTITARAETAGRSLTFRPALRERRCLIPASGFFAWRQTATSRQPFWIARKDRRTFSMAGLWERWKDRAQGAPVETFAILTVAANRMVAQIHERMPAIIDATDFDAWLGASTHPLRLLRPHSPVGWEAYPVSTWVNSPAHDDPRCIESHQSAGA